MTTVRFATAVLVGLLGAQPVWAQQAVDDADEWQARLQPGAYEVVSLQDGSKVTGTFVRVSGNSIEID